MNIYLYLHIIYIYLYKICCIYVICVCIYMCICIFKKYQHSCVDCSLDNIGLTSKTPYQRSIQNDTNNKNFYQVVSEKPF